MSLLNSSADSNGSSQSSAQTAHPGQEYFPEQRDSLSNTIVNPINTSPSTSGALAPTEHGKDPGNHKPNADYTEQRSVARARAIASSRLQHSTSIHSFRADSQDAEVPAESAPSRKPSTLTFVDRDDKSSSPIGKWHCCICDRTHDVYSFAQGQHPISTLNCVCAHRSCSKCTLEGLLKPFVPMNEPEVVPLSEEANKQVRFGTVCDGCGCSWRAQEVPEDMKKTGAAMKSALRRVTAIPKRLQMYEGDVLRVSRSMDNLRAPLLSAPKATSKSTVNLRALANDMAKEHGEQADVVSVRFTGIKCSCGMVTDSSSLCFQIVDPPRDFYRVQFIQQMAGRRVSGFSTTPEDKAKGHGTPTLVLKGGCTHPNPLMSNPVF